MVMPKRWLLMLKFTCDSLVIVNINLFAKGNVVVRVKVIKHISVFSSLAGNW